MALLTPNKTAQFSQTQEAESLLKQENLAVSEHLKVEDSDISISIDPKNLKLPSYRDSTSPLVFSFRSKKRRNSH